MTKISVVHTPQELGANRGSRNEACLTTCWGAKVSRRLAHSHGAADLCFLTICECERSATLSAGMDFELAEGGNERVVPLLNQR